MAVDDTKIIMAARRVAVTRTAADRAMAALAAALTAAKGRQVNVTEVARESGLTRKTVYRQMGKDY